MKYSLVLLITLLLVVSLAQAQNDVWVNLEKGTALFLNPKTMQWEPIVGKHQLPAKTYILTKKGTVLKVFKETEVFNTPAAGYFFLSDVFQRDRMQVIEEITSIEAQQLPSSIKPDTTDKKEIVGLTYGMLQNKTVSEIPIPNYKERINAIEWFQGKKRYDAALLSLKRTMTQFPVLYLSLELTDLLCRLYDKLEFYGFIFEETNRLMVIQGEGNIDPMITRWNDFAKKKLTNR